MVEAQDWHRRHALQLAAQLPEKVEDALIVLGLCQGLVEGFLTPQRASEGLAEVLPFRPASSRAS